MQRRRRAPAGGRRGPGPAFGRFWGAYTAGNLADGMMLTALPLVAALLTSDPLLVGGLTAVRFLPWLLFGVVSGAVVDRVDRVRAMRAVALVRASAMGLLAVLLATGNAAIWALYAVMFTVMVCETVYDGAARAHVPVIVARDRLDAANSRMEGGRVVTEDFGGAPVAGILFGVAAALPVATGALAYLVSAVVLFAVPATARRDPKAARAEGQGAERSSRRAVLRSVAADTRVGFRYLARNRVQAGLVGLTLGLGLGFQMASSVLVLFVQQKLGVPPHLFGVFVAASAVGALAGAAVAAPLARRVSRRVLIVGGFVLAGLFLSAMGAMASPWAAALLWGLVGATLLMANALGYAVLQAITPNGLFGRVEGVRKALGWGLAPVGGPARRRPGQDRSGDPHRRRRSDHRGRDRGLPPGGHRLRTPCRREGRLRPPPQAAGAVRVLPGESGESGVHVGRAVVGAVAGAWFVLGAVGAVVLAGFWRVGDCSLCVFRGGVVRVGPGSFGDDVQIWLDPVPITLVAAVAAVLGGLLPLVWNKR